MSCVKSLGSDVGTGPMFADRIDPGRRSLVLLGLSPRLGRNLLSFSCSSWCSLLLFAGFDSGRDSRGRRQWRGPGASGWWQEGIDHEHEHDNEHDSEGRRIARIGESCIALDLIAGVIAGAAAIERSRRFWLVAGGDRSRARAR